MYLDFHIAKDYQSVGFYRFEGRRHSGVSLPRTPPSNETSAKEPPSVGSSSCLKNSSSQRVCFAPRLIC